MTAISLQQNSGEITPSNGYLRRRRMMKRPTVARHMVRTVTTLLLASLSDQLCKLCLSPIYGSIPSGVALIWYLIPLVVLSDIAPQHWWTRLSLPMALLGYLPPYLLPVLANYGGRLGPYWGPRAAYAFTSFPILFGSLAGSLAFLKPIILWEARMVVRSEQKLLWLGFQGALIAILSYIHMHVMRAFEKAAIFLTSSMMSSISGALSSRYGMQALIATLWTSLARSKWTASLGVLPLIHVFLFNPHLPLAHNTALVNATLQAAAWSLVARQESLTGYISVLDNVRDGFRVMRCDHSLLGGEWRNKPEGHPARFNEPIYSIFVMLEAVRLVEAPSKRIHSLEDEDALVIGLGVGTAPSALIAHGVHTTTVEIDPIVHEFATNYFGLPHNHTSIIGDATKIVNDLRDRKPRKVYDYIIHDVFTGGAEPIDLFTLEFLTELSNILKWDGVIAINYAGDLLLPSAISVIGTVLSVFGKCRLFREVPEPGVVGSEDFTNLVMFCRRSKEDFTFRRPVEADFLGSPARQQHLSPKNEILKPEKLVEGKAQILRTGQTEWLQASQMGSAMGHWHVMRKVLPDLVWEAW